MLLTCLFVCDACSWHADCFLNILQAENFEKLFTLSVRVTLGFRKNLSGQG